MYSDGTINLREERDEEEPEFKINDDDMDDNVIGKVQAVEVSELDEASSQPYGKVKVKFDKFVSLVASHAYEEVFEKHIDEDVIISTDLLTDLANAHEEKHDKKMPLVFIFGIALGIALTWILLRT